MEEEGLLPFGGLWADEEDGDNWMENRWPELFPAPAERVAEMQTERKTLTQDDLQRWASWTKPFPLPPHLVPCSDEHFQDVSDEMLMAAPPHVIAHIQRTAAQDGLQIISPRQTPMTCLMGRISSEKRELGDHVVGGTARLGEVWPTIDGDDMSRWLPDEPLPPMMDMPTVRSKTRTEPLTKAGRLLKDPILACLVKGRAVIDIQQRADVMGDAEKLTMLLAAAWGISPSDLFDLDAFTLGVDGPLLRHAIKADEVYPIVHAPIHQRLSISVGSNEVTRDLLPEEAAMDWRRMRVFCECVYLMSLSIEGIPLAACRASPPPGDPSAPTNRPNILAFAPSPCTAWSFEASSFSICPVVDGIPEGLGEIPTEVLEALARYVKIVRPMSMAMARGFSPSTKQSVTTQVGAPAGETITQGYIALTRHVCTVGARGKNASRAIRNLIFMAIDDASENVQMRLTRYMYIAANEVQTHLKESEVPDEVVNRLAVKFLAIGDTIRLRIASEAHSRGSSVEEWWSDFTSQAPERYKGMMEGTMGWARVGMWLLFRQPTEKWSALTKLMHYKAVREAQFTAIGALALPPQVGSLERLLAAARGAVRQITSAYFGYYEAVSDVGFAIAKVMEDRGQSRSALVMKEGCYLWTLRARALRGTNVDAIAHDVPTKSVNHLRVPAEPSDLVIAPAPYRAFEAYKVHAETSEVLFKDMKRSLQKFRGNRVSEFFTSLSRPAAVAPESVTTRYLLNPAKLGADMEKSWRELTADVARVVQVYALEAEQRGAKRKVEEIAPIVQVEYIPMAQVQKVAIAGISYDEALAEMDYDEVEWYENNIYSMDPGQAELIMNRVYVDVSDFRRVFNEWENQTKVVSSSRPDAVM